MILCSFIVAFAGFAALAAAMDRHHRDLIGGKPSPRLKVTLRIAGAVLLALSLGLCIAGHGVEFGLVWWAAALSMASTGVLLAISFAPPRSPA